MVDEIDGAFDELAGDRYLTVDIDGNELKLEVFADDLTPIMTVGDKDEISEEDVDNITGALRNVLYRTYLPHWNGAQDKPMHDLTDEEKAENEEAKQKAEAILRDYFVDLFRGVIEQLDWDDQADGTVKGKNLQDLNG